MSELCPCSSERAFEACCGPYLRHEADPPTAEALMRSRYTAFTRHDLDYVVESHHPDSRKGIDRAMTRRWMTESEWLGLDVETVSAGGPDDEQGTVDFVARYRMMGREVPHREHAIFKRHQGRWYFVDSKIGGKGETKRRESPKVGRNDPCHCGSGKKFKACHGKAG